MLVDVIVVVAIVVVIMVVLVVLVVVIVLTCNDSSSSSDGGGSINQGSDGGVGSCDCYGRIIVICSLRSCFPLNVQVDTSIQYSLNCCQLLCPRFFLSFDDCRKE